MLAFDPTRPPQEPKHAATVLVLRDAPSLEVFLVRRATTQKFLGGAYVFPGGKLDEADLAASFRSRARAFGPEEAAARLAEYDSPERAFALHVAACRETLEEAGVLFSPRADNAMCEAARKKVESGATFAAMLDELHADLDLEALVPLSRWITPKAEARRFDARFFLARVSPALTASHDANETIDAAWLTPKEALERELAGGIQLAPPTLATLDWLSRFANAEDALAAAAVRPPPRIDPEFVEHEGEWILALPGDPAHERKERVLDLATRFALVDGRWVPRSVSP